VQSYKDSSSHRSSKQAGLKIADWKGKATRNGRVGESREENQCATLQPLGSKRQIEVLTKRAICN